ncbi:MAG: ATP-binding protein [Gammaproteobacteria bacterium]|nr:ATP-binding protein [Gammaproteobacteria bacterium]
MSKRDPLSPDALYRVCDLGRLDFETTDELEDVSIVAGQTRAFDSLRFGVGIRRDGFNIFALGSPGGAKMSVVEEIIQSVAPNGAVPSDWCYVYNFDDPQRPRAIRLPAGGGIRFRDDMNELVEELVTAVPAAFENEDTHARLEEIREEFTERKNEALEALRKEGLERRVALVETPSGITFAPLGEAGQLLDPTQFQHLSEDERKRFKESIDELQERLQKQLRQFQAWGRDLRKQLKGVYREIAKFSVGHLITALREKYSDIDGLVAYFDAVENDIVNRINDFLPGGDGSTTTAQSDASVLRRYRVNVIVDNSSREGAPVIYESLPTQVNLIGRAEHQAHMGTLVTDFTLIRAGALHRANGGYLLLDAHKVISQPFSWDKLKRALQTREIHLDSPELSLSMLSGLTLEPEPIPLDTKVILVGERYVYFALYENDPEFSELFKVAADFNESIDRTEESEREYARLVATISRREGLKALDRGAIGRLIEHSSRIEEDSEKLSVDLGKLTDLLKEADYWSTSWGRSRITDADVQQAIEQKRYRSNRVQERVQEEIRRGVFLITTDGMVVGQVNALSVLEVGELTFGQPCRITATIRVGDGEVVDIERETEMGGPIHSKGVLILSNFLMSRYSIEQPISLAASIVFEQSYSMIDGDSASLAELCALLSSLANIPIRQGMAITGSVNQLGQVQPIGGVNEKIESFFDVCSARGLTGKQGVIVPESNVKHLMLRHDVVQAAAEGIFQIHAVANVDEAIELLTGRSAGTRMRDGRYPRTSVNGKVVARLLELSEIRREFVAKGDEEKHGGDDD